MTCILFCPLAQQESAHHTSGSDMTDSQQVGIGPGVVTEPRRFLCADRLYCVCRPDPEQAGDFGYITTCCMYRAPIAVVEAPAVALYSWHLWCAADLHVDVGMCRAMQMVTPCWML